MEDSEIKKLITAFTHYYCAVPVSFVRNTVTGWHPEVTPEQFDRVLKNTAGESGNANVVLVTRDVKEPQLVQRAFYEFDGVYERFQKIRKDLPFAIRSEEEILKAITESLVRPDLPETQALFSFAQTEMGLDSVKAWTVVFDAISSQRESLWTNESWVVGFIKRAAFRGTMKLSTQEMFERFRDLGNNMYRNFPNIYLRGWKPSEFENSPSLPDDLPKTNAEVMKIVREICNDLDFYKNGKKIDISQMSDDAFYGALLESAKSHNLSASFKKNVTTDRNSGRKIGRNEPCPCGSGKKYKKCCGR